MGTFTLTPGEARVRITTAYKIGPGREPYRPAQPLKDPAYLAFIRAQPCSVPDCRATFIEAAHIGSRGLSQKSSDRDAIPLCHFHHQPAPNAYHKSKHRFERACCLNLAAIIRELNRIYDEQPERRAAA
jgi:hypothetical protein